MRAFFIIVAAYLLAATIDSHAAEMTGQCVFPKTAPEQIQVFKELTDTESKTNIIKYTAYKVGMRNGAFIAIWSVPDNGKVSEETYQFVGWIDRDTVDIVNQRNCN